MKPLAIGIFVSGIVASSLVLRRWLAIRRAMSVWRTIARTCGLLSLPPSYFRLVITGVSTGIGLACVEMLKDFPSVEVIPCGRAVHSLAGILVDLNDSASVRLCANEVTSRLYHESASPSMGQDIFINNAGVYGLSNAASVWKANLVAPCFFTESVAVAFVASGIKGRALRFVQVGSRLESSSRMNFGNVRTLAQQALEQNSPQSSNSAYADTKRGLLYHTSYMCSKYEKVKSLSFCVVTPGMVNTSLGHSSVPRIIWWLTWPLRFVMMRHPSEGAVAILWAAFGCPAESGVYTADQCVIERIHATRDPLVGEVISEIVNVHLNAI